MDALNPQAGLWGGGDLSPQPDRGGDFVNRGPLCLGNEETSQNNTWKNNILLASYDLQHQGDWSVQEPRCPGEAWLSHAIPRQAVVECLMTGALLSPQTAYVLLEQFTWLLSFLFYYFVLIPLYSPSPYMAAYGDGAGSRINLALDPWALGWREVCLGIG